MFISYLQRDLSCLCVVYALSITLSPEAQSTGRSSGNSGKLMIRMYALIVNMEGKTRPGTHEALPAKSSEKGV